MSIIRLMLRRIIPHIIPVIFILCSCSQATIQPTATPEPMGLLTPYLTLTASPIASTITPIAIIPVTPAPTPTPFLHTIKKGETMLGIAFTYGISLDELKTANPGVDPQFLSVGMQLAIPLDGEIPEVIPTPTAIPLETGQPACYRTGDGGVWCIYAVGNPLEYSVENLSVWIGLYDAEGSNIASQVVYAPINILRPGGEIPLMAYFPASLPEDIEVHAEILSGISVAHDDERYLNLEANVEKVEISRDGTQAMVSGEVIRAGDVPAPSKLWVFVVAYDPAGNIIGGRKWESPGEMTFQLPVYSLAGMIDHIAVLIEARP